jgi:hypothetical protein
MGGGFGAKRASVSELQTQGLRQGMGNGVAPRASLCVPLSPLPPFPAAAAFFWSPSRAPTTYSRARVHLAQNEPKKYSKSKIKL